MTVTVSVICPVYNRRRLIGETLQSLLDQTRTPDEIIVVDDGSSDGSADFAASVAPSARIIRLISNQGPGAARNAGLRVANGSHVLFFDSDDLASRDYIEARVECAELTDADIVYGSWMPVWIEGETCGHDGFVRQSDAVAGVPLHAFLQDWVLFIPNCLIRRSLLLEVGGYPEAVSTGEDMLLLSRLLRQTENIRHVKQSVLLVRQHPEGQISAANERLQTRAIDNIALSDAVTAEVLTDPTMQVPWTARLYWLARSTDAIRTAQRLGIDLGGRPSPTLAQLLVASALSLRRRIALKIARRLAGHSIDSHYTPSRVDEEKLKAIYAIGYLPVSKN